jgi:hypothetical protein
MAIVFGSYLTGATLILFVVARDSSFFQDNSNLRTLDDSEIRGMLYLFVCIFIIVHFSKTNITSSDFNQWTSHHLRDTFARVFLLRKTGQAPAQCFLYRTNCGHHFRCLRSVWLPQKRRSGLPWLWLGICPFGVDMEPHMVHPNGLYQDILLQVPLQ